MRFGAAPTLGSALAFLQDVSGNLRHRMRDVEEVTEKIENFESLTLAEIQEVRQSHLRVTVSFLTCYAVVGFNE